MVLTVLALIELFLQQNLLNGDKANVRQHHSIIELNDSGNKREKLQSIPVSPSQVIILKISITVPTA